MKKTSLFIIACVVVSLTFGALTFLPGSAGATTLYVGGGGPGNYTTIQGAIDDANPGDSVFVYNGTYYENVVVDKPLSLIGESKDTTSIYNAGTGDVILVASDWVNVTGLMLRYAAWDGTQAAIRLWSSQNCHVGDNNVLDSNLGIALDYSSNNTIANNSVFDNTNYGIYLWHSDSNTLINNTASRNEHDGIRFYYANNNTVANNTVSNNSMGISLHFSPSNVIIGNALSYNEHGIFLWHSTNITLASNAMKGTGIYLRGSWLEHWNTHTIGTSNTVNNKPVIYWKDVIGGAIPLGAGQVILANTTHVVLENQNISNTSIGIQTGFSSNVTIANNTVASNSLEGISLRSSSDNTIMNNTAYNNRHGIFLDGSNRNIITRNNASSSDRYGIYLHSSKNNTIIDNHVSSNWDGIHLYWQSNDNIISNNTATENMDGISVSYCVRNAMTDNLASANNWYGIDIASSEGDTIDNNTASENFIGIRLFYTAGNLIRDNVMVDDGILVWGDSLEHWNTHTIETSNTVNGKPVYYWKNVIGGTIPSGAGQVILANCMGVSVESQNVSGASVGVELGFSSNNTIIDNNASLSNEFSIFLFSSRDNIISNNSASSNYHTGISLRLSRDNLISDNTASSNNWAGIYLRESGNNTIERNNVSYNGAGIDLYQSGNNTIVHNHASNNTAGIFLRYSHDNSVLSNTVLDSQDGIHVERSNNNTIDNNRASRNTYGIALWGSSGNHIAKNTATYNLIGFYLTSSDRTMMRNNTASLNGEIGFYIIMSHNNTISNNTVFHNNGTGMRLLSAETNAIYHNSIVDNAEQANDTSGSNQWDNGYPSGGNYWSDYDGEDLCSGPNQDQPGSDWIGDTPYLIDADSLDRYPLMSPAGTVPPAPPTVSDATLSGEDLENVTLLWSPSQDDGAGRDTVVGYRIFRNSTYDPAGLGYELIAIVPNGTTGHTDTFAGEGDSNEYFYQVCAVDLYNNTSCSENQAAKFTRPLAQGPNLVSIPLVQSDESIETVLETVQYDKAWSYDSFGGDWKWHMTFKDYRRGLWSVNHTMGVWVNVTGDCNLIVAGIVPAQTTIHLRVGWNLVSFPSFNESYSVSDLKAEMGATRVEGYDLAPPNFLRVLGDAELLQAGEAYWISMQSEMDWTVEAV